MISIKETRQLFMASTNKPTMMNMKEFAVAVELLEKNHEVSHI